MPAGPRVCQSTHSPGESPRCPRLIPTETGIARSVFPNLPRLSTPTVHLSTLPLLSVTRRHDPCLKYTRRSAQTRPVPDGDTAATACHGLWITGGQPVRTGLVANDRMAIAWAAGTRRLGWLRRRQAPTGDAHPRPRGHPRLPPRASRCAGERSGDAVDPGGSGGDRARRLGGGRGGDGKTSRCRQSQCLPASGCPLWSRP